MFGSNETPTTPRYVDAAFALSCVETHVSVISHQRGISVDSQLHKYCQRVSDNVGLKCNAVASVVEH